MTEAPAPKPWIGAIAPYVPGRAHARDGKPLVKLSANENPLGCSNRAIAAMRELQGGEQGRYPDPDAIALREAIGARHGIDPARIVCGTGSGELLGLAAQGYAGPGDEVVFVRYGFSLYEIVARRVGATPVIAPDADYGADIDALLAAVTPKTRLVFLADPNNPTGTLAGHDKVLRLHAGLPSDVLLVLDQAYAEYLDDGGEAAFDLAARADNVLVTRTFSKIYGLAGERIGWATGAPPLIDTLNRIRGPFNVTRSGQAAAVAALGDQQFVAQSREHNARWRAWFAEEIARFGNHGVRAVPSHANFVLLLFEGDLTAEQALHALADAGYATRWLPGQDLPHGLRITIGTEAQMREVVRTLRSLLEGA